VIEAQAVEPVEVVAEAKAEPSPSQCPYLYYKEGGGCSSCWGFRCSASEVEKRIVDTTMCKTWPDYTECVAFVNRVGAKTGEASSAYILPPVKQTCPYMGTPPQGKQSCSGAWCYARNQPVRVSKGCEVFEICTVYLMSKFKGVPFHGK